MRRLIKKLFVVLIGCSVGLLLAEGTVRLMGGAGRGTIGVLYEADADLGWRHKPHATTDHVSEEFAIHWAFNGYGVRRPDDVSPEQVAPKLAVLGDSHTAGHGVSYEHTFARQMEEIGKPIVSDLKVLNFGVDGYSTSQQLIWVREQAPGWKPRGIVVGVYLGNDLRENLETSGLGIYERPRLDGDFQPMERASAQPVEDQPVEDQPVEDRSSGVVQDIKDFISEHSELYLFVGNSIKGTKVHDWLADLGLMRAKVPSLVTQVVESCQGCWGQLLYGLQGMDAKRREIGIRTLVAQFKEMDRLCRERGVPLLAVMIPSRLEVEGDPGPVMEAAQTLGIEGHPGEMMASIREDVVARLQRHGVSVLDVYDAAIQAAKGRELYYEKDWHLNPAGHELVAREVMTYVTEAQWLQ